MGKVERLTLELTIPTKEGPEKVRVELPGEVTLENLRRAKCRVKYRVGFDYISEELVWDDDRA